MTRTSERTTITSEAVPDVALTLSADRGYDGTALSQIAEALELRLPSLHNHTQSKHGLLTAPAPGPPSMPWARGWTLSQPGTG
jgi:AcrR family transcriptional regulator